MNIPLHAGVLNHSHTLSHSLIFPHIPSDFPHIPSDSLTFTHSLVVSQHRLSFRRQTSKSHETDWVLYISAKNLLFNPRIDPQLLQQFTIRLAEQQITGIWV